MSERTAAAVTILRITDELDMSTTPKLCEDVEQALAGHPQTLVLDLAGCAFAGVDAVETLAGLTARARAQDTALVLVGLRPVVRMAIGLLGLENRLLYGQPPAPRSAPT